MNKGNIKWFNMNKAYGFITQLDGGDVFFHLNDLQDKNAKPTEGDSVTFNIIDDKRGPKAQNISIIKKGPISNRPIDKVECSNCQRTIIPRMILNYGQPIRTVCPFCANEIADFTNKCFIATAVYGGVNTREVEKLRKFRDNKLRKNRAGRAFIAFYYKTSPPIANWLIEHPKIASKVRLVLDKLVSRL